MKSISDYILTHNFMWKQFDAKRRLTVTHKKEEVAGATKAILFFPYWTGNSGLYKRFARQFPNHTKVYFDYPNEVVSANIATSIGYIKRIVYEANIVIRNLRRKGIQEITLFGSSFGSNIALKLATMTKIDKVILNTIDKNYVHAMMNSPALIVLRKKLLRAGFTIKKLDAIYKFISTDYLVPKIKNEEHVQLLICTSNTDIFCPHKEFEDEIRELDKRKISYELVRSRVIGHILSIYWNVYLNKKVRRFIEG